MITINLTQCEIDFIKRAIELDGSIVDYELEDKEFKDCYGYTKEIMRDAVTRRLRNRLK